MALDLDRFRNLAFRRATLPDHPLQSVADAQAALEELAHRGPHGGLAELTNLARTMNENESFTPGRRAQILLTLDEAARRLWHELGEEYLAPGGGPLARDGDPNILRAMFDSASEFANGFAITRDEHTRQPSAWVQKNLALVFLRNMRWNARRLALAHMLHLPVVSAIWERIHLLHRLAEENGVARFAQPVFAGNRFSSSVRQEYARCLLLELGAPESMPARQIELAFRVTGRVASTVRLEAQKTSSTAFAVVPAGDSRPVAAQKLGPNAVPAPLYIDTTLALPKLRVGLERDMGRDDGEPDTLYGGAFTLRERFAMMNRLLEHWGMDPPQRRARRITMASPARVIAGFESVVNVLPALCDTSRHAKSIDLQLRIEDTTQTLTRARLRAAAKIGAARVIDASNGGLGIAIRRQDAKWAVHGALLGVLIEPGKEWVIGVLRRIFSIDEEMRLGIQVLSTRPQVMSISPETLKRDSVWEDAMRFEATFKERYRKAILLDPASAPPGSGELLLEPGIASKGSQFDVPCGGSVQRVRIARMLHADQNHQRVLYETLK
jgi:hypothetical protein